MRDSGRGRWALCCGLFTLLRSPVARVVHTVQIRAAVASIVDSSAACRKSAGQPVN